MTAPNPIPDGPDLDAARKSKQPKERPQLPVIWNANILLSPFGDSVSPLRDSSQLVVGTVECSCTKSDNWMRVVLYLTQDQHGFEFIFRTAHPRSRRESRHWYWVDSSSSGRVRNIYGPFPTTLRVPESSFFAGAAWGNSYPLMCTDTNKDGIECDHWLLPSPGSPGHASWYAFKRETGLLFRILMLDSSNPLMLPILGSYFIANLPTFAEGVSRTAQSRFEDVRADRAKPQSDYWNPMVTQQDIQRAMASPLASSRGTPDDIEAVIPGFTAARSSAGLPVWSNKTFIRGWSIGADPAPYSTQIRYIWTNDSASKQQSSFIGVGALLFPDRAPYSMRSDICLGGTGGVPRYEWNWAFNRWEFRECIVPPPPVGPPRPNWLEGPPRALIMGRIRGNPQFGLVPGETLNLIAATPPHGDGQMAIFWAWFLDNGVGMLFSEANYINPMSHNLQVIDYNFFLRDADLTDDDFSNPCGWPARAPPDIAAAHGHLMHVAGGRVRG